MAFGIRDAQRLYGIDEWGAGFFGVNTRGHLTVHPLRNGKGIDLYELLPRLKRRKLRFPMVVRFPQILETRVQDIFGSFERAIEEFDYPSTYRGVFPIKVNQLAPVLEGLVSAGRGHGMGLEAGSKAELALALSHETDPGALVICNGYKDDAYIRLALAGRRMGREVILIVEKPDEVDRIIDVARKTGIRPKIGVRIRLATKASGKWEKSSGPQAKFGLTTVELVGVVEALRRRDMLDSLALVHFHAGSQITQIKRIKNAVKEGARVYAKLKALGCPVEYLDVGGGLGVDYDGSNTSYEASINYSVTEYANDVVYIVKEICEAEEVTPPILVSESGRALVAYHSLLLCQVTGQNNDEGVDDVVVPREAHDGVHELLDIFEDMNRKNHREYLHDAEEKRDELQQAFLLGYLNLRDRALSEQLMQRISKKALGYLSRERHVPEESEALTKRLVNKYIANFSVFQSIPDSWALDQLFPIVPIHRLDERPTVEATLCDVTCDSDGEIDRFVDFYDVKSSLPLHVLEPKEDYVIAVLLIGAYQDVLGDYHNLFGRVDEVHVGVGANGQPRLISSSAGDVASEVLSLFGHEADDLKSRLTEQLEVLVKSKDVTRADAKAIEAEYATALASYTYLDF